MLHTSAGRFLVNDALPEDLRDHNRVLDKKGLGGLLQQLADRHPDQYRDTLFRLTKLGHQTAQNVGGDSFDLHHFQPAASAVVMRQRIKAQVQAIAGDDSLTDHEKDHRVTEVLLAHNKPMEKAIYEESLAEDNPLARPIQSGSRGKPMNLKSLRGGDLVYVDHKHRPIPVPVLHSFSEGLRPVEYYAAMFGARRAVTEVKSATQDAGFTAKLYNQAAHRLLVTQHDHDDPKALEGRGLPTTSADPDNEGALLAHPVGGYRRNVVLTPKILADLRARGHEHILVRSPMVGGPADGGVFGRDVGYRERGGIAPIGDHVGLAAAQALSEVLTQAQLSSKHSGGVAGAAAGVTGYPLINQLVSVPKTFKGGAAHAQLDGRVSSVDDAPQGGKYVVVEGQKHYVAPGYAVHVKRGQEVEAGDVLSEGIPNPAEIVQHKGIGEGRRYFVQAFRDAYKGADIGVHRRNVELLSRGLIDHVRMTDEVGHRLPNDVVPYSALEHDWRPRAGSSTLEAKRAVGHYLEQPVLHHSIGTKIRPSMLPELERFGVKHVVAHPEPPPFQPEMVRGLENLTHDPDWMTRFLGSYQEKNLLKGVHRGDVSDEAGTSYVPSLARGVDFGKVGPVHSWKPGDILKS
jgi:DNA-directed RNA polymerase subunit beta'